MNKLSLLKVLNLLLFISVLAQALSGLVLFFGLFRPYLELITEFHGYNGFVSILLIIVHVGFNWNWMKANYFKKRAAP